MYEYQLIQFEYKSDGFFSNKTSLKSTSKDEMPIQDVMDKMASEGWRLVTATHPYLGPLIQYWERGEVNCAAPSAAPAADQCATSLCTPSEPPA